MNNIISLYRFQYVHYNRHVYPHIYHTSLTIQFKDFNIQLQENLIQ